MGGLLSPAKVAIEMEDRETLAISPNKTTMVVEALIEGKAEEIANKAMELALAGDSTLLRTLLNNRRAGIARLSSSCPRSRPLRMRALPQRRCRAYHKQCAVALPAEMR